jgi:hypothetical protein
MNKTYALKCIQGHPHFGHWTTINVFADEFVAHDVCKRAQARHEELRDRFPKDVRLTGLNPFDPGYDGPWVPTRYFVEVIPVFDNPEADSISVNELTLQEQSHALETEADFLYAGAVELNLAGTRVSRECSDFQFNVYEPAPLLRVSREASYTLYLTGGLIERKYVEGGNSPTWFPASLDVLSAEEKQQLSSGARVYKVTRKGVPNPESIFVPAGDHLEYTGRLQWHCDTQPEFRGNIDVLPGTVPEMLSQLITVFSNWNQQHFSARRAIINEHHAARHASSEATSN